MASFSSLVQCLCVKPEAYPKVEQLKEKNTKAWTKIRKLQTKGFITLAQNGSLFDEKHILQGGAQNDTHKNDTNQNDTNQNDINQNDINQNDMNQNVTPQNDTPQNDIPQIVIAQNDSPNNDTP